MTQNLYESLIKQIADSLARRANSDLRKMNLTMPQAQFITILANLPEQKSSFKEMEKKIHMAQSTTVGLISRLERKNLVKSFVDPEDKRVKFVQLTEDGRTCVEASVSKMQETQEFLLSGLTEVERIVFLELLKKIGGYMK